MMMSRMQQEQDMHTLINKRPFYSIIIPCYNSGKTIGRVLDSIIQQKLPYQDIQVIISDDCSTESYQDIIDSYKDKLFITQVQTDYNCCPGNTRQRGVDAAIGQWITFMDHDDQLIPESYKDLKVQIQKQNIDTAIITRFYKQEEDQYYLMPQNAGWTHGKFFNLDNFWKKYNLHYIKDMTSHEDVCLSTELQFIRVTQQIPIYTTNIATYIWIANPESLSNRKYIDQSGERVFIDKFFVDYMQATAGIAYQFYQSTGQGKEFVALHIAKVILYSYFYNEYARDKTPQYLISNCNHIRKYLLILQDEFNITVDQIYNFFKYDHPEEYQEIFSVARGQIEIFLFEFSFKEWLNWIMNQDYLKA